MIRLMEDTSEEEWERLRQRTPAQRFLRMGELWQIAQHEAEAEMWSRYPDATEREIKLRVASQRIPAHLMRAAFGWDPDVEGY